MGKIDLSENHSYWKRIFKTIKLFLNCFYSHHHNVTLLVQISLTLSQHLSLSSTASGRPPRLHPVSVQSCSRYVLVGQLTLACPCKEVHRRLWLMSLSLLLQQCPACLVHLIWMVLEMGGRWPYNCWFIACCFQDLFNIACSILVKSQSNFFSICFVSIHVVHPYSRTDTTAACRKLHFILANKLNLLETIIVYKGL